MAMREMSNPSLGLMLLDESLENVDPIATANTMRTLKKATRDSTILYVTHDASVVPDGDRRIVSTRSGGRIEIHSGH